MATCQRAKWPIGPVYSIRLCFFYGSRARRQNDTKNRVQWRLYNSSRYTILYFT